jgi:hypothetical protein
MTRTWMLMTAAAVLLCAAVAAPLLAESDDKTPADPLATAKRAVGGVWVAEQGISDPIAPHGRFTARLGINGKIVHDQTWWFQDGKPTHGGPIYEGSTYWHPGRKEVAFYQMSQAGELFEGNVEEREDGTTVTRWKAYSERGVVDYESHGRYLDDDTMTSTVYVRRGEELHQLHAFKFHRKPEGWPETDESADERE